MNSHLHRIEQLMMSFNSFIYLYILFIVNMYAIDVNNNTNTSICINYIF